MAEERDGDGPEPAGTSAVCIQGGEPASGAGERGRMVVTVIAGPADILLPVRAIGQHGLFDTADPLDNRACWYAAAMMVLSFRGPLPPNELMNLRSLARLRTNHGIQPHDLGLLADEAGMEHAAGRTLFPRMGAVEWHAALSALGPMIVVVGRHAVVVRGIVRQGDGWAVAYNDPFTATSVRKVLIRFNAEVDWRLPMLYRRAAHRPPVALVQPVADPYAVDY